MHAAQVAEVQQKSRDLSKKIKELCKENSRFI